MNKTRIEWCDATWNPVIGCRGTCHYCYARKMATRFHMTPDFSVPTWSERNFQRPFPLKPSRIFVNSMSDIADWTDEWFDKVTCRIAMAPEHTFLFLSKRPWLSARTSLPNAMLGYSVIDQHSFNELEGGMTDFLSIEPIHGPIDFHDNEKPRWIIVGAETGNRRGKVVPLRFWLREINDYARAHAVPLFFKESLRPYWPRDIRFPQDYPK